MHKTNERDSNLNKLRALMNSPKFHMDKVRMLVYFC